jgi:hypothetical protein
VLLSISRMETVMGKYADVMEGRVGELYVLSSRSKEKPKALV